MPRQIRIVGMVDPHVHLRGMQWAHKATFFSETAAAVAGGYWAVLDMPNTPPSTITVDALNTKLNEFHAHAVCDWGVYFGASQGDNQHEYDLIKDRVCGLKIYNNATTGDLLISDQSQRDAHFAAWPPGKPIAVHAEGETVAEIISLVRKHRKPTHFLHISTEQEIDYLAAAKQDGLPVTVGVCPHHLWLTENDITTLKSYGLMRPTLKTQHDQDALWKAIDNGIVDVIESDHAPHTVAEKESDNPPYGVPGLETTLPLLCTAVRERLLSMDRMIDLISTAPRRIYNLRCPADTYTVIDLDASFIIDRKRLNTHCGWSPFEGMRVYGKVTETWIRGCKVYDGESVCVEPGFGENLYA